MIVVFLCPKTMPSRWYIYVIRDENLLVEMCYIAISFVLPLIWEQKTISSFATFAWVMIDISIPVMELLTVSFGL